MSKKKRKQKKSTNDMPDAIGFHARLKDRDKTINNLPLVCGGYNLPIRQQLPSYFSKIVTVDEFIGINIDHNRIVFTNGCFDILHKGHLDCLRFAQSGGGLVVVGLNSDRSIKKLKGNNRPIFNENDRAYALSCLSFVDFIIIFDEDTPLNLIEKIKPAYLIKGGDYKKEDVIGSSIVGVNNTYIFPYQQGYSTTNVIPMI